MFLREAMLASLRIKNFPQTSSPPTQLVYFYPIDPTRIKLFIILRASLLAHPIPFPHIYPIDGPRPIPHTVWGITKIQLNSYT